MTDSATLKLIAINEDRDTTLQPQPNTNTMKNYYITAAIICLCCLLAPAAEARLGETKAECHKRYGDPVKVDGDVEFYVLNKLAIKSAFENGKCASISYKVVAEGDDMFTIDQIAKIAKINTGANEDDWVGDNNDKSDDLQGFKTGKFYMLVHREEKTVIITTMAFVRKTLERIKKEEDAQLNGI